MSRPRRGRAGSLALGLVVVFLLAGYAALRLLELSPRSAPAVGDAGGGEGAPAEPAAWSALVALGEASVLARLFPLHDEPALEEFRAGALRARYALPAGRPWRLYLSLEDGAGPVRVDSARVDGLAAFAELVPAPDGADPVYALLAARPAALEPGRAHPLVLWGEAPSEGALVRLAGDGIEGSAPLARAEGADARAPRWYAGESPARDEPRSLADEVARLERELARERARRAEREEAYLQLGRAFSELPGARELGLAPPLAAAEPPSPEEEARLAAEEASRARAQELGRSLSVLMRLEGLRGLDLLEPGSLLAGPPPGMGPVVFRCLDERGLLTGSLSAERLRLSGSAAAHTLTLVLEDGFESRGGERVPFEGGVRRITLREVDPEPWRAECPELFDPAELERANDDGRWVLADVRRELNRLLALDVSLGWYRLHSLGGVLGTELRDVQIEELEPGGRVVRRLFADRMTLALEDASLVLELSDGASVRGEEKTPFRDGRLRVVLPGVELDAWSASALPGFSEPPAREKPAEAGRAGR